ncbi:MAG: gliding motility-associated C-terminal domain-containing protein, partial [Bacteroidota bacterium]
IEVFETPDATITDPGDFCSDDAPENLTAATTGGTWSGNGITDASAGTFDPSVAGVGTSSITYEVSNAGCTGSDMIDIQVFDTPDATITDPGDFCSDDTPQDLTAATAGGTWSGDGITDASAGTFDPSIAGPGDHVITYTVGSSGCDDTYDITITVNPSPDATITDPGDFCSDDTPQDLTAATAGGTWSGNGITDASDGTFDPSVAGVGTSTITYEVTESGCTGTGNIDIEVYETPDATIDSAGPFCYDDDPVTLSAATPGGSWSGTGITDDSAGIFDPETAGIGSHTITYSVSSGPCSSDDQVVIDVVDAPDAVIDSVGTVCQDDSAITLSAATPGGMWSGTGITDSVNGIFDPGQAQVGDNIITYEVSIGSCSGSDQITITVIEQAEAQITDAGPYCYGDYTAQLQASNTGGIWTGNFVDNNGTFDVGDAGAGTHQVSYIIPGTCGDTAQQEVQVYPTGFTVDYEVTEPYCYGGDNGQIEFEVSGGTPPYTYQWDYGSSDSAVIAGLSAGEYSFTISDANGCNIEVTDIFLQEGDRDCLRIPNVFTPNEDGVNDTWIIENLEYYPEASVEVYNRWGQLLYEGGPGTDPWDGTYNGKPVPTGSYIYVIKPFRGLDDIVGIVTVVR